MEHSGRSRDRLSALWDKIHKTVFAAATTKVPYDPGQDAWHAPTTAIWMAASAAGLIGFCLATPWPVPSDLQEEWGWYLAGHWPCGYSSLKADDNPGPLLVF